MVMAMPEIESVPSTLQHIEQLFFRDTVQGPLD
jgi:hypothetical protein